MKLSMMSYTVGRQAEHYNLQRMLDLTEELKLDGIDFVTLHNEDARTLRKMCDDRGIKIICHTFMADFNHPAPEQRKAGMDIFKQGLENTLLLGARIIMMPTLVKADRTSAESRKNWTEALKEAVTLGHGQGVEVTVENFPGILSPFVTSSHFLEAQAEVPGLKLTFDSGNAGTGENPAQSFTNTARHVVHAHFKDWDIQDQPAEGFRQMLDGKYYRPALIGEGKVPHKEVLTAMKKAGYNGCINIEYEGNKYDPYEGIRRAAQYLRGIAAEIGY